MQNQKTQKSLIAKVLVLFAAVSLMFVGVQVFANNVIDLNSATLPSGTDKLTFKSDEEAKQIVSIVKALKAAKVDKIYTDVLTDENVDVTVDVADTNAKKVIVKAKTTKPDVVTGGVTYTYVVDAGKGVSTTSWYKSWWFLTLVAVTVVAAIGGGVFFVKKNKKTN